MSIEARKSFVQLPILFQILLKLSESIKKTITKCERFSVEMFQSASSHKTGAMAVQLVDEQQQMSEKS